MNKLIREPEMRTAKSVPGLDLLLLVKNLQSNIALIAEEYGLTLTQLYTLHAISDEHKTMGMMAHIIRCDASNVTGIIDKLVLKKLVIRREGPTDRRIKTVQLTPGGSILIKQIVNSMPERLGYSSLSQKEISDLRRILIKLVSGFPESNQK